MNTQLKINGTEAWQKHLINDVNVIAGATEEKHTLD
jgi:hypothetical protein